MRMPATQRNHATWIALLLAIVGLLSYFTFVYQWPITRDVPWVNYLILLLAVALAVLGVRRAWPHGGFRRTLSLVGAVFTFALAALLPLYALVISAQMPDTELGLGIGAEIPGVSLTNQNGREIQLAELASEPLVVVFYRGHW